MKLQGVVRDLSGSVLAVLLILYVAGVAMAQPAVPTAIRAQGLNDPSDSSITAMAQRAVLRAFSQQYPDIVIERFSMPTSMDSGPLMAIAAGMPPHAMYVNFRQSSTYMEQGFLEPLEVMLARLLSADPRERQADQAGRWLVDPTPAEVASAIEQIKARVTPLAWPVVYREDESGQHPDDTGRHVWAIPTSTLVMALLYRKDLFAAAGLDPERPPTTWEELLDDARKLTLPDRNQYGMSIAGGGGLSWGVYTFLVSNGARAVERTPEGQWRAAYGTTEAAEAIAFVWRLVKQPFERDGRTIIGATILNPDKLDWDRGKIAMRMEYLNDELLANINPQLVGIAPVPLSPRGTRGSELNCQMLGVFSGGTPQQKLAAMQYIWFITGEGAQKIRTRVYVDNGFGTFVSPELLAKFGYDRLLQHVPASWKSTFAVTLAHGVPEPYGHNTQHIYRDLSKPIHQVLELDLDDIPPGRAIPHIRGLLEASVQEVNTKVLGIIPGPMMRQRRIVAGLVVAMIFVVFSIGGVKLWRHFSQPSSQSADVGGRGRHGIGWALLAPAAGLTFLWMYAPLVGGLVMAFTDYRLVIRSAFVGLDNFANVLYDAEFWASLGRTFYYVVLMIVLGFWPPILLAIVLDEVPTAFLKYVFRTVYYLPAIISGVFIMFLWKQLYDPSPNSPLNQILLLLNHLGPMSATLVKLVMIGLWLSLLAGLAWLPVRMRELAGLFRLLLGLGALVMLGATAWALTTEQIGPGSLVGRFDLQPLRWIQSPDMAMLCVVLALVWAASGPGCLLYLAALKTVPSDLYEAADIDGANLLHKVFYITLPRLQFLIGIQFIAAIVGAFKGGTDYILAMTGGGPNDATMILALRIFIRTFMDLRFGIGAAMAWLLGLILVSFTAYQLRMLSRAEFTSQSSTKGS